MSQNDGMRRCSAPNHKGKRDLPTASFHKDRAQPSGYRSWCKDCLNTERRDRYSDDPGERDRRVRNGKRVHKNATDAADARDEALIEQTAAEARKIAKAAEKAEAERQARDRRLSSEFAQLKPDDFSSEKDDFDTSVANDPKSNLVSKQASAEKRQEYSEAMGKHLHYVRGAAVTEAKGDGEMVEQMPAEAGKYIGALAEQERRFGNRRLARSISLFSAGEELSRRLWIQACKQYLTGRVVPTGYAEGPATPRR
jgi:hypothetical protein